jgi:hypothetical protein
MVASGTTPAGVILLARLAVTAALEEPHAEPLLDLSEPAERGRVVNAEGLRGAAKRAAIGDRLHMAKIVPRKHPLSLQSSVFTAFANQKSRTDVASRGR